MVLLSFYPAPLLIGLFSTVHCLGMCGGIMGVLTASLPHEIRQQPSRFGAYVLAYNIGRLLSYALAGSLFGLLGGQFYSQLSPSVGYLAMQWAAAILMVGIGLYLGGWFPRFAIVERLGIPLWKTLEPLGRRLLPVHSLPHALLYGMIWGWLPCGLVYSALLLSLTAPGPLEGALYMTTFGVGTLPAVMGAGMLSGQLIALTRKPGVRRTAGILLIAFGLAGPMLGERLHSLLPPALQQQLQCESPK